MGGLTGIRTGSDLESSVASSDSCSSFAADSNQDLHSYAVMSEVDRRNSQLRTKSFAKVISESFESEDREGPQIMPVVDLAGYDKNYDLK